MKQYQRHTQTESNATVTPSVDAELFGSQISTVRRQGE